jgi:hypothetical protein
VNALFVALLIIGTTLSSVGLGVLGTYCALTGLLTACNPSRPKEALVRLVPREISASGD